MLIQNLNIVYLIAAIVITVVTVADWAGIGRWGRVVGVTLAVLFFLVVNYSNL